MKRTLAIALIAGALLLAGCSRPHAGASPAPASSPTAAAPAHRTSGRAAAPAASSADDVSDLLNQVDKQLQTNDQPSAEQD
jgi:PBP1b-binding outer membrane lipoprotein LpoB